MGGQPGRGRAGFGPPAAGFKSYRNRGNRDNDYGCHGGMSRPTYTGRYSFDRK